MTKRIDDRSEAKQRIRSYLKERGIDMSAAERRCGFKRGFLSAGGVIGSDKLAMFITAYPEADLYQIVTGDRDRQRGIYEDFVENLINLVTNLATPKNNMR